MEARVREFQEEADYAMAQHARAQIALSVAKREQEEYAGLREALETRERELAEAESCVSRALARLEEMREAHVAHRAEVLSNLDAISQDLSAPESEVHLLRALAEASKEQDHVRAALAATRERLKLVEFEWEKTKRVLAIQTAEMDALRYAAASQVASATIQAGEMEHRIDTLESALTEVEAAAIEAARDLPEGLGALRNLRFAIEHMQRQLAALKIARTASSSKSLPESSELSIFDTDFFEVLPEDFHVNVDGERPRAMPGLDDGLKSALEDALTSTAPGNPTPEDEASGTPEA